ncbi:MAG: hypothetical protein ACI4MI_03690 [Christensenellales bacterium]
MNKKETIIQYLGFTKILVACLALLTICCELRRYIYDNINATFTFIRLGAEGVSVSVLTPILLAAGVLIGAVGVFVLRRRISHKLVDGAYLAAAFCSIITLIFNPYNLQLVAPDQNLQNITSFNLLAVMVFATITVAVLCFAIGGSLTFSCKGNGKVAATIICIAVTATVVAIITTYFNWSFVICLGVYTAMLLALAVAGLMIGYQAPTQAQSTFSITQFTLQAAVIVVCIITVMIVGFFITDNAILF